MLHFGGPLAKDTGMILLDAPGLWETEARRTQIITRNSAGNITFHVSDVVNMSGSAVLLLPSYSILPFYLSSRELKKSILAYIP